MPGSLAITKAPAGGYSGSYPDLTYRQGASAGGALVATYTEANDSSAFVISGDSLTLKVGTPAGQCVLTIRGAIAGAAAAGTVSVRNGCGPNPGELAAWTATKQ